MNLMRQWKRMVGGLAAALVLLPVPAMAALTFNGSWAVSSDTQSGVPTPPQATFSDSTSNATQTDNLTVNMGQYSGKSASSTIELTRGVTLSSSNQLLEFEQSFSNVLLTNAGVSLSVSVKNSSGTVVQTPLTYNYSTTGSTKLSVFQSNFNNLLKSGAYTLDVKLTYVTNNKIAGGWNAISAHHFEFVGY